MNEMTQWFEKKDYILRSAEEEEKVFNKKTMEIMALRYMITISSDYKNKMKEILGFNYEATNQLVESLKLFLYDFSKKIHRITSKTLDFTVIKIISALEKLSVHNKDNYLVLSSTCIQENREKLENALNAENNHIRLLVVVYDLNDNSLIAFDEKTYYENLVVNPGIQIILIGPDDTFDPIYGDLSEETKKFVESRKVLFQGTYTTVRSLVGENIKLEDIMDSASIKELLMSENCKNNQITIPALNPHYHHKLIDSYIPRRITFPYNFDHEFWNQLSKELKTSENILKSECQISAQGNVEWFINDDSRKSEIWEKMKTILNKRNIKPAEPIVESELVSQEYKPRVVILTGVAGTGKSTILHSLYQQINNQSRKPLVIRMNFADENLKVLLNENFFSNVIDFFVYRLLPPAIRSSPFTQSMIRHRLQTSGGIVIMMDGFDEMNDQLQKKAIQFMKAISETKLDRLYVTSRPHLNDKLQDGFFQFTCKLEHFSEKEQIDYLCECWETDIQITSEIKSFAESLVKKVAETLNDKEKAFVGIPLQCKILAEIFARRLKVLHNEIDRLVQQQQEDLIGVNKFDLLSLYKQLMNTKEEIFQEKLAIRFGNFPMDSMFAKLFLRSMNEYHTNLALRTIVSHSSMLDFLWSTSLESEITERDLEEGALIFGLTLNNSSKENHIQLEFIHKTFAEYLMAKYFYEGLLLDDIKANRLLQNDCNLQFFVESILVLDEYDGVRTFLDSMFYDVVESEEWWEMVQRIVLPQRFLKLANELVQNKKFEDRYGTEWREIVKQKSLPKRLLEFVNRTKTSKSRRRNFEYEEKIVQPILEMAVMEKHSNIFRFITDCLDGTQDPSVVRSIMCTVFGNVGPSHTDQSREVIQRFIYSYEDDEPGYDHTKRVVESLPPQTYNTIHYNYSWDKSIPFSYWNQKETKANVESALDFLLRNPQYLSSYSENESNCSNTLYFFICNDYYDNLDVHKFVKLLSKICDDESLTNIFSEAFRYTNETDCAGNLFNERIPQFLIMLQKLKRHNVVKSLSRLLLMIAPDIFEEVCLVSLDQDDNKLLTTPNSLGLTRLHIAAFKNCSANTMRGFINDSRLSKSELANILMDKYLSPLYMAAAYENKDAFHEMLSFLKEELTTERLIQDFLDNRPDGFLFRALLDAIKYERINMFQLILSQVKEILSQDGLLALLGPSDFVHESTNDDVYEIEDSDNQEHKWLEPSDVQVYACQKREFMKTIAEFLDNGYGKLNEFLFKIDTTDFEYVKQFRDVPIIIGTFGDENLRGMIQAEGGFSNWLKLVFDKTGLYMGFSQFTKDSFLNFLRNNGLVYEFFQTIISSSSKRDEEVKKVKMSYWAESFSDEYSVDCPWFDYNGNHSRFDRLLKFISENEYGQERLKELVLHNPHIIISKIVKTRWRGAFEVMLKYLSEKNRKEICEQIFNYLSTTAVSLYYDYISNVIWFLSRCHLQSHTDGDFICQILLSNNDCEDDEKCSNWSLFIQISDNSKELESFLDWVTVQSPIVQSGKSKSTTDQKKKVLVFHNERSGIVLFKATKEKKHNVVDILLKYSNEANNVRQQLLNEGFELHLPLT